MANHGKIYISAVALSKTINQQELNDGRLYPEVTRIREVSVVVAREVIRQAQKDDLDREKSLRYLSDADLDAFIQSKMYDPAAQNGLDELKIPSKWPGGKSLL